jgi:hypothetical protein
MGVPTLGVPGQNDIWVLVPWPGTKYPIRGRWWLPPKSGSWWVLWVRVCMWFILAPKCSNYVLIKLWFGLCISMWVIELLVNHPSPHPRAPTHPSTLEVLQAKERAPTPPSIVSTFGLVVESIKELRGASCVTSWDKTSSKKCVTKP